MNAVVKSKVYGASDPSLTATLSGFQNGDTAGTSGITGSASCSRTPGETVGSYTITCGPGNLSAPNYSFQTGSTANFSITKAVLNVNAVVKSKVYGASDPSLTATLSGFQNGDTAGTSGITGSASCSRTPGETVGSYTITCGPGNLSAPNYSFQTGSTANFSITKAPSTTTVMCPASVVYSGSPQTPCSASVSGANLNQPVGVTYTSNVGPGLAGAAATFPGDANHQTSSDSKSFTIQYASGPCFGSPGRQILQPINADGTSIFKQGSTVPAKFRVCDSAGNSIGTPGLVMGFALVKTISGTTETSVNEAVVSTTPDTAFRSDTTDKQWIFNINTKNLQNNKTYVYQITLNDTTTITFQFGLK